MHILSWLAVNGTAAIVEFPGVMYRGGAEQKIRKYLVDNNYVDAVIQLPKDLFFGTSIATCILVLKKSKIDNKIIFMDASSEFSRQNNKNKLQPENCDKILELLKSRQNLDHFVSVKTVDEIVANEYLLSVSSYVEPRDTQEAVDIALLNQSILDIASRQNVLRNEVDSLVRKMGNLS